MIAKLTLTKTQKYYLAFILALVLTLTWTTLARADGPGDLDTTFGGTGIVTTSIGSGPNGGFSVAIQPDGKIVVAGGSYSDARYMAVIRHNSDGSLDTTFNNTGVVTTPINEGSWGHDTAIQPDGKIVVTGYSERSPAGVGGYETIAVARYNITGTLDTDFNNAGVVTTSLFSPFPLTGWSIALQPDGKILIGGVVGSIPLVFRYTITGTLDTNFGHNGYVGNSMFPGEPDVAVQPDGNIVVASSGIFRYTTIGNVDYSFNGTGYVATPFFSARALKLQPDGKIVAAGNSFGGDFAIARYNSDGSQDTTFNGTGIVTTPITSENDGGLSLAIQLNGKIVVAGFSGNDFTGDKGDIALVRYNSDGGIDTTFGNTGVVTTPVSNTSDMAWGVAIQSDGKIVAAGFSDDGTNNSTFAVVRYIGDPPVTLTKTVNDVTPNPGQLITYTLFISNSGTFSTTNLLISDTLPMSLTLADPVTLNPSQSGAVLATSALSLPTIVSSVTISPMTAITITIPVTVSTGLSAGVQLTNTATMTSPEMSISVSDTVVIAIASGVGDKVYLPVILKN